MAAVDAENFLSLLFGHPSLAGLYLAIWDKQSHRTHAFQLPDLERAAADAVTRAESADVYFGVCPYVQIAPGSRGEADLAGALVGVWLDVDVKDPTAHKASNLPETREQAFDLIYEMPTPPTVVVSSGYGLQAWWALDEPFVFRSEADRLQAAGIAKAWVSLANQRAQKHGWMVDPVGELGRVLRLPGTFNRKGAEPRAVEIVTR
jgi:putative DNA primase/helicase